jgi:shikimate dehydrogenase
MRQYGLIGHPLTHSFSEKYFSEKFRKENISADYKNYPIAQIQELPALLLQNKTLSGFNVTIPYKESVIPYLNDLDTIAGKVGAVNCVKVENENGSLLLKGYNTDVYGFKQSIKPFLESHHSKALILGAGGASKAVAYVLGELGFEFYHVVRNEKLPAGNYFNYSALNEYMMNTFKLIVNTTPVGMFPDIDQAPAIPYQFINSSHLLYDLIYNPEETMFLKKGTANGAATLNGLSMLHLQAEKSWEIWNS